MSNKLQNIKAVREMIAGTHKTQTRKSFGFSDAESVAKKNQKHEVGDTWEETTANGAVYIVTQHDGFRSKRPKNSVNELVKDILRVPDTCPECGGDMRGDEAKLNTKFWGTHKKCFGCVLKEETAIRNKGPEAWREYEKDIMRRNAEGWFKDADREVELLKQQLTETYWQNADGKMGEMDISGYTQKVDEDYQKLKEEIRSQLE